MNNYPDPSTINQNDFYSSAFRIMKLLRRRGWQGVVPMDDGIYGLMPQKSFKKWSSFTNRKKLIKTKGGGKEFERFVAQIILQHYCNPATFSNKILDLAPGGDYDILVEGPSDNLFYFETKGVSSDRIGTGKVSEIWNFMIRDSSLGSDMSVFVYDHNHDLSELLIPVFEILYSLAGLIKNKKISEEDVKKWIEEVSSGHYTHINTKIGKSQVYFMYWPVVVIGGGDNLKANIGEALSLFCGGIKYLSPYDFGRRPTREPFGDLLNWKKLPKDLSGVVTEDKILEIAKLQKVK